MFRNFTYPGSDFHELNLDFLLDMCCKFAGLRLEVQGDYLRLVNDKNEVVSSVQISYADHALKDIDGNMIQSYIISAGTSGDTVVFTKGDNSVTAITVPYSDKAKYDVNSNEITDYVLHTQIAGDKLRITKGDGTVAELTIPYSIRATGDEEGNDITTYATTLAVDGDTLVLRDRKGRLLNQVVCNYSTKALQDADGNVIKTNYGSALQTGTTTVKLIAKDGTLLSEITVPYATRASNADFATLAEDANNAIESVAVVGDNIVFTTYDGVSTTVTCPYSVKALKDANSNEITKTYVASVTNNVNTGEITFYDAEGTAIVSITPQVEKAKKDTYNNLIADYIKQILVDVNSNYVTVVHGTGTTDSLIINYSTHALDDINDQAIHNTYITLLECVEDVEDGHYKIVAYDGDTPKAELFRFEVIAYSAQTDINGKSLTSYVADVDYNASKQIKVTDGEGNTLKTLANKLENVANVDIDSNTLADGDVLTYDANADEWQNKPASGGGGPVNPVWTSSAGNYYANHQTQAFGHIATIFAEDQEEAEIVVGGIISVSGESWGEYSISDIYPNLVTINGVQGTMFTVGGPGLAISGDNTVVCDVNGNPLNYTQTLGANDCIAVTPARDAYMSPGNAMRSKPIIPLYCYIYNEYISGDHAIFPRVRCIMESSQVMTRSEIFQEITQGGYTVYPFYCYGKVALNYL